MGNKITAITSNSTIPFAHQSSDSFLSPRAY